MDDKYLSLLEKNLDEIRLELKELRLEIKDLNTFKWRITGAVSFFSVCFIGVLEGIKLLFRNN